MKGARRGVALLLAALLLLPAALAAEAADLASALSDTGKCVLVATAAPAPGTVGGEWAVFALARMGAEVPKGYYDGYLRRLKETLRKSGGVLHKTKYSEYARTVLALTAIGVYPGDVGGYDLLAPLGDYDQVVRQGLMGPIMALLALDCGGYEVPAATEGKTQADRVGYVDYILERQLSDGSFSLSGKEPGDPDITAMALQALAKYREEEAVAAAADRALDFLSAAQMADGGYGSWGSPNAESAAQVLVALCELGVPIGDERFVKNGRTVADALLDYYSPGEGFSHVARGKTDAIATEQGTYALAALARAEAGESSLYCMETPDLPSPQETPAPQATEKPKETPRPQATEAPAAQGQPLFAPQRPISWPDRGAELLRQMIGRLAPPMRG